MSLNPFSLGGPLRVRSSTPVLKAAAHRDEKPEGDQKPASPGKGDDYLVRLAKLAPPEVISVFLALKGFFPAPVKDAADYAVKLAAQEHNLSILACIATVLAAFWRWSTTHQTGQPPQWKSIIFATISFVLWVYATGGTVLGIDSLMSHVAAPWPAVIATIWTFLAPQLQKGD